VSVQIRPLSPEHSLDQFEQRSLANDGLQRYLKTNLPASSDFAATPAWSLETLTLAAFYYSPELAVVWANYETVAAGKQTAAQRPNPAVSISPAYNTVNAVPSPWLVTATLRCAH